MRSTPETKDSVTGRRKYLPLVQIFGIAGICSSILLNDFWLAPELFPNPIIFINIWVALGLIFYLLCWPIAYFRLLVKKDDQEIQDLEVVSVIYFVVFIWISYDLRLLTIGFLLIYFFTEVTKILWVRHQEKTNR